MTSLVDSVLIVYKYITIWIKDLDNLALFWAANTEYDIISIL